MKQHNIKLLRGVLLFAVVFIGQNMYSQSVSYGQHIGVFKKLKADLTTVGVMTSNLSDKGIEEIQRVALQLGVKVFFAKGADGKDVPSLYKTLVNEKKVQFLWIPNADDRMLSVFEYLKENAVPDKVGLCVPDQDLLTQGGLIFVTRENGKITAYVNQKMAAFVGVTMPSEEGSSINFVSK